MTCARDIHIELDELAGEWQFDPLEVTDLDPEGRALEVLTASAHGPDDHLQKCALSCRLSRRLCSNCATRNCRECRCSMGTNVLRGIKYPAFLCCRYLVTPHTIDFMHPDESETGR